MPFYESIFIVRQDVPAPQVEALAKTFADVVTANGGKVTKTEQWGLRSLAYRIKKNKKGHYVLQNLDAPVAAVDEMERQMRLSEDVLRYLTCRVEELEAAPSAMLRKEERVERSGFERTPERAIPGTGPQPSLDTDRPRRSKTESQGAAA